MKAVHQFTYLRYTITSDAGINKEVDNRLTRVSIAFGRLYKCVWYNRHLKKGTTLECIELSSLPLSYTAQSWVTYQHHLWCFEWFHQCCSPAILNIHWSNFVTNIEVLEKAKITNIEAMLLKTLLHRAGHISRMEYHRLPKILMYGKLSTGCHSRGSPKKQFKDCLKKSFGACHIDHCQWFTLTENCDTWLLTTDHAVSSFENSCRAALKDKTEEEVLQRCAIKPKSDLQLQLLWLCMPVLLWPYSHKCACNQHEQAMRIVKPNHDDMHTHKIKQNILRKFISNDR